MDPYPHSVRLINFVDVDRVNQLLHHVGIESELGPLLAEHLTEVLRRQYSELVVSSIELTDVRPSSCDLPDDRVSRMIGVEVLRIPVEVIAIVSTDKSLHRLELTVTIVARTAQEGFSAASDVIVRRQVAI